MNQLLTLVIVIAIIFLTVIAATLYLWSAKKTLIRGGTSWSAKEMPIKRSQYQRKKNDSSLLESIASETNDYLKSENQLNEKS